MKRRIISVLLSVCLAISLTACGENESVEASAVTKAEEQEILTEEEQQAAEKMAEEAMTEVIETVEDAANIESDKNLLTIEVTFQPTVDDRTDEELEELRNSEGYVSITRNEDNSITYVITKEKQKDLLNQCKEKFATFAEKTPGSEDYPNVTNLEVNDDFSIFTITTTATSKDEISFSETILASVFYSFGGTYRGYACEKDTSVTVNYVCESTGEQIASGNSANVN